MCQDKKALLPERPFFAEAGPRTADIDYFSSPIYGLTQAMHERGSAKGTRLASVLARQGSREDGWDGFAAVCSQSR